MIAVDTNILVYAHRRDVPQHRAASSRLRKLAEGGTLWAIPIFCLGEFVRVVTHPRLFELPHSAGEARTAVENLVASPSLRVLLPGERFLSLSVQAIEEANAIGNLVCDALIVASCREAGVDILITEDRDFDRFRNFPTERLV
ncbi:MAG: TA system VapC family ribonuclease toxin [Planctomycetota bacterium]